MIIIDGYNLLRFVQAAETDSPLSDFQMCHIIGRYLRATRQKGQVVFDGIGPPYKNDFHKISGLKVYFSGRAADADSVIRKKINASSAPKNLMIVSSDREIRGSARARKAGSVKSDEFWADLCSRLNKKRHKEPPEKRGQLTESETERWLKFFKIQ